MIQKPHLPPIHALLLCGALCAGQAHAITAADDINGSLEISPSAPTASWPDSGQSNQLAPNYTATISVTVTEEEEIDGVNYTLSSGPDATTGCTDSNVIWTESNTTYSITNTAADTASATMTLTCTWSPDAVAGGGNGTAPADIQGQADADIQLLDSVVDWEFDRHSQWADLSEEIGFEVTITDYNGFGLEEWSLTEFTPANATPQDPGWEIIPAAIPVGGSGWLLSASAFSENESKGNVKIKYNEGSEEERTSDDEIVFFTVDFITPTGDPVASPVDAGNTPANIPDGANQFTFNDAATGVLTMKLKAQVSYLSSIPSSEQDMFGFELDPIGSSTFAWGSNNPGGKAEISGNYIIASATYTGLPTENSDFGLKECRVKYDDNENPVAEDDFEAFFMKNIRNHPGGQPNTPNWFYYWSQFLPMGRIAILQLGNIAGYGDTVSADRTTTVSQLASVLNDQTQNEGLHAFYETLVHESHHIELWEEWWGEGGMPNGDDDTDGDCYPDEFELSATGMLYGFTVPEIDDSYAAGLNSAGHIYEEDQCRLMEQLILVTEFDSQDWSHHPDIKGKTNETIQRSNNLWDHAYSCQHHIRQGNRGGG